MDHRINIELRRATRAPNTSPDAQALAGRRPAGSSQAQPLLQLTLHPAAIIAEMFWR